MHEIVGRRSNLALLLIGGVILNKMFFTSKLIISTIKWSWTRYFPWVAIY